MLHAVGRTNFLLEEGDFEGPAVCRTILRANMELEGEPDEAVN